MRNLQLIFVSLFLAISFSSFSQVGIGTDSPDASAALDITSTTGGFLMPRMTNAERLNISEPAAGLMVYVTDFDGGTIMIYEGTKWKEFLLFEARTVPDVPTIGTITPGVLQVQVSFTAPSNDGGSPITAYTATSSPGGFTGTLSQSGSGDITVRGLTNATAYTFTVTATNAIGTSLASTVSNSVVPDAPKQVGDFYQGGVVFHLYENETNGLIAAVEDQGSPDTPYTKWYNGSYVATGATATAVGTGNANTDAIIAVQGPTETSYAAELARAYTGGGYTDWFLPSKDELNQMYINRATLEGVSGFSAFSHSYWSSTEDDNNDAWYHTFTDGHQGNFSKSHVNYVRAVRAF